MSSELVVQKRMRKNSNTAKPHTANLFYGEISVRRNFLQRYILTAKIPYGEISLWRNILMAKFLTAKFPTAKFPVTDLSHTATVNERCFLVLDVELCKFGLYMRQVWPQVI